MFGEGLSNKEKQRSKQRALFERVKMHIDRGQNPIDVIDALIEVIQNKEYKSPVSALLYKVKRELALVLQSRKEEANKEVLTEEDRLDQAGQRVTADKEADEFAQLTYYDLLAREAEASEKELIMGKQRTREHVLAVLEEARKKQKDNTVTFSELLKNSKQP